MAGSIRLIAAFCHYNVYCEMFRAANALQAVVPLLSSSQSNLHAPAAQTLAALVSKLTGVTEKLVSMQAMNAFLDSLMSTTDMELQEALCSLITAICKEDPNSSKVVVNSGAVFVLATLLSAQRSPIQEHASSTLAILCSDPQACEQVADAGGLGVLATLLSSPKQDMQVLTSLLALAQAGGRDQPPPPRAPACKRVCATWEEWLPWLASCRIQMLRFVSWPSLALPSWCLVMCKALPCWQSLVESLCLLRTSTQVPPVRRSRPYMRWRNLAVLLWVLVLPSVVHPQARLHAAVLRALQVIGRLVATQLPVVASVAALLLVVQQCATQLGVQMLQVAVEEWWLWLQAQAIQLSRMQSSRIWLAELVLRLVGALVGQLAMVQHAAAWHTVVQLAWVQGAAVLLMIVRMQVKLGHRHVTLW
jgi:hypothetical protein